MRIPLHPPFNEKYQQAYLRIHGDGPSAIEVVDLYETIPEAKHTEDCKTISYDDYLAAIERGEEDLEGEAETYDPPPVTTPVPNLLVVPKRTSAKETPVYLAHKG